MIFEHGKRSSGLYGAGSDDLYDLDGAGPLDRTKFIAVTDTGERFNFLARK